MTKINDQAVEDSAITGKVLELVNKREIERIVMILALAFTTVAEKSGQPFDGWLDEFREVALSYHTSQRRSTNK